MFSATFTAPAATAPQQSTFAPSVCKPVIVVRHILPPTVLQLRRLDSALAQLDYIDRIQVGLDGFQLYTPDGYPTIERGEASRLITLTERHLSRRREVEMARVRIEAEAYRAAVGVEAATPF